MHEERNSSYGRCVNSDSYIKNYGGRKRIPIYDGCKEGGMEKKITTIDSANRIIVIYGKCAEEGKGPMIKYVGLWHIYV